MYWDTQCSHKWINIAITNDVHARDCIINSKAKINLFGIFFLSVRKKWPVIKKLCWINRAHEDVSGYFVQWLLEIPDYNLDQKN